MREFFYPLLNEVNDIQINGGINIEKDGKKYNFLPFILQSNLDLQAKKDVQQMVGPIGYFGCGYCLNPGYPVKANQKARPVVRFIRTNEEILNRTHDGTLKIYKNLKSSHTYGIKNISCMIAAKHFDLINSFSIDYLHAVLLGVVKKIILLWLDPMNHLEIFYFSKKKQTALDNRVMSIKPPLEISRKPRSFKDRADFKGNEFRSLLLYYLPFSLKGLLPEKFIKHFLLLSSSTYILLEENISYENISFAEKNLNDFVNKFEELYGQKNVTMNVHLLKHIAESVRYLGPLWHQSTFCFETFNGILVHSRASTKDYLQQLAWKYCMNVTLRKGKNVVEPLISLGKKKKNNF